ncbi:lipopolysaccharide biosynthesis protein [Corallincola spongiicola]|uniref:lipopolysaccharide biosynthesis protein n=1 Tax=Corallincola spongiicola TaxID=2520508 RepID=UPI0013EEB533|nr:oligosaccharide flippase family protein [Corallincola spongiicola]
MKDNIQELNRNKILASNVSMGVVFKFSGIIVSYLTVPVLLNYLGYEKYGVWMTIFSVLSWIYTFDVGIGNGLKIWLTEAIAKGDDETAKKLIATAYIIISVISVIFFSALALIILLAPVQSVINSSLFSENYLKVLVALNVAFFLSNFIISLYKQLLFSVHKSAIVTFSTVINQAIVLLLLVLLPYFFDSSLIAISLAYGFSNIVVSLYFSYSFFKDRKQLVPNRSDFDKKEVKRITGVGLEFFIIQLCAIVIFATDNMIISSLLGPAEVTNYSIVNKFYQAFLIMWYVTSAPLSSLYMDAYIKRDFAWISRTMKKLHYIYLVIILLVSSSYFWIGYVLELWIGEIVAIPDILIQIFIVFVAMRIYGDLNMSFLNAIGKLKLQVFLTSIGAAVNIPLSIYFVKVHAMGISGVILATCFSLVLVTIFMPLQVKYVLKKSS